MYPVLPTFSIATQKMEDAKICLLQAEEWVVITASREVNDAMKRSYFHRKDGRDLSFIDWITQCTDPLWEPRIEYLWGPRIEHRNPWISEIHSTIQKLLSLGIENSLARMASYLDQEYHIHGLAFVVRGDHEASSLWIEVQQS